MIHAENINVWFNEYQLCLFTLATDTYIHTQFIIFIDYQLTIDARNYFIIQIKY